MRRIRVRVGRKVILVMTALPVMLLGLQGVGVATERVTDGWLHSEIGQEARQTRSHAITDGWYHSEIGEQARGATPARQAVTDGWLGSVVGQHARSKTADVVAATENLAGSTDGWLHSVVGDAAREQQPVRVVSSPAQTHLPDTTLIVSVISTALLAGMAGFFVRARFAL